MDRNENAIADKLEPFGVLNSPWIHSACPLFGINQDGTLTSLGDVGGLSASAGLNGIAVI